MTKEQIKTIVYNKIDNSTNIDADVDLSQPQLTKTTDDIAKCLQDTVNPNGPGYPSSPR